MYCRFIVSAWCFVFSISAFAQNNHDIKKGDACMKRGDYAKAAAFYKMAADANMNDLQAKEKLGKAFVALGDYQSAEAVYHLLATNPMASDTNKFYYAQMLNKNGKSDVAAWNYKAYFDAHPGDPLAREFSDFTKKVEALRQEDKRFLLTDIPENSSGSDEGPTFCVYNFCFTSNGHAGNKKGTYNLYMLHGGNPTNPASPQKLKGRVNGRLNEGPATFSSNGLEMIFTRSNRGHRSKDGSVKLGLYHADYDTVTKDWKNITPLSFNDFNYNFKQPSLSMDGSKLFFVSDMPGGFGETDIYMCAKQGNTWGAPVNLGSGINTIGREETPFINYDGNLYFASDSRVGLGGLDIYVASFADSTWGHAVNPGAPLNSSYNDFGYISDPTGHSGYIVSDRPGGMGGNDIYHFTFNADNLGGGPDAAANVPMPTKESIELVVNVSQKGSGKMQGATAVLFNPVTGKKTEQVSDTDGYVKFEAEPNQEYVLKVTKTDMQQGGYEKFVRPISTLGLKPGQTLKEEAQLVYHEDISDMDLNTVLGAPHHVGSSGTNNVDNNAGKDNAPARLPNVYFAVGSYNLNATAIRQLDKIVALMKARPGVQLEISSNTDATGSVKANLELSARRALACLNYFMGYGISKDRFIAVGYGDKKPVNNCAKINHCTEAEQAQNRRTEFKIIGQ